MSEAGPSRWCLAGHSASAPVSEIQAQPCDLGAWGKHLEYLALVINSPPEIVRLAIDPDKHFVQVPTPAGIRLVLNPLLADRRGERRTEPVPPEPHRLVTDIDPTFEQQILDLPQRQGIADQPRAGVPQPALSAP